MKNVRLRADFLDFLEADFLLFAFAIVMITLQNNMKKYHKFLKKKLRHKIFLGLGERKKIGYIGKKFGKDRKMAKKICLVDGSGYIFRAFYALPLLSASDGTPTNAVLGFLNMFARLTTKIDCDYCLVLFDAKRQNFRNDIFADYKGTRRETPEELIPQFPIIRQAVDVLSLNHLEMEGYEADDLIATYTKMALDEGMEAVIVSADKD